MKDHVDVGWQIVVKNARADKLNCIFEVLRRTGISIVKGENYIRFGELVHNILYGEDSKR